MRILKSDREPPKAGQEECTPLLRLFVTGCFPRQGGASEGRANSQGEALLTLCFMKEVYELVKKRLKLNFRKVASGKVDWHGSFHSKHFGRGCSSSLIQPSRTPTPAAILV